MYNDDAVNLVSLPIHQVSLSHWLCRVVHYLCAVLDQAVVLIHSRVPSRSRRPLHVKGYLKDPRVQYPCSSASF